MIHVDFDVEDLPDSERLWYDNWRVQAAAASDSLIQRWHSDGVVSFTDADERLWKSLRDRLFETVFHRKCAYCERKIFKETVDAEHYRPKAAVRHARASGYGVARVVGPDGSERDHPGYFWLALDWRNILPACKGCNALAGKLSQFPVEGSHRLDGFPAPSQLDRDEVPLLLNPYRDSPERHLSFNEFGSVAGTDLKGELSIEVYSLEHDSELRRARHEKQLSAETAYYLAVQRHRDEGNTVMDARRLARREVERRRGILDGSGEFSSAVRTILDLAAS